MGLTVKIKDANFTNFFASLTLPDRTGLVGEYVFGTDAATSGRNRVTGLVDGTAINTPTFDANTMGVKSSSTSGQEYGMQLTLVPSSAVTMLSVFIKKTGTIPLVQTTGGANDTGFYVNSASMTFSNGYSDGATDQAKLSMAAYPASPTALFAAGVGQIGQVGKLIMYNSGVAESDVGTRTDSSRGTTPFRIGGRVGALYGGGNDIEIRIAYLAVFNRRLSDAEVAAAYAQLKAYYALRGLTIS